jgi:hypothetical protein
MEVGFWPLGRGGAGSQLLAGRGSPFGNRMPFSAPSRCYYPTGVRCAKARAPRAPGGAVQQLQRPGSQQRQRHNAGSAQPLQPLRVVRTVFYSNTHALHDTQHSRSGRW